MDNPREHPRNTITRQKDPSSSLIPASTSLVIGVLASASVVLGILGSVLLLILRKRSN